jgi:hypothetical protein
MDSGSRPAMSRAGRKIQVRYPEEVACTLFRADRLLLYCRASIRALSVGLEARGVACTLASKHVADPGLRRGPGAEVADVLTGKTGALNLDKPGAISTCTGRESDFGNRR